MILCVFLTFSTVNAVDLNDSGLNSTAIDSQSESSFTNLNEDVSNNIVKINEDEDCVDSMNELSNLNDDFDYKVLDLSESDMDSYKEDLIENNNLKSSLSSINSDENSLKSTLSPSGNTFSSIQDSISNARPGDTINLNGKTFTGNGTVITINKSITISGGQGSIKATLDAKRLSGILKVTGGNVKIVNCNFINSNGKAVYILNSNGSISNCDFKDNYASTLSAHLLVGLNCSTFLVENSNFINGSSGEYSNVAVTAINSTVKNCTFIDNVVENDYGAQVSGGGLQIGQSVSSINIGSVIDCVFINNSAISNSTGSHAGALCFRPGIKVFNTTFIDNYCNRIGGATTLHSDGELYNCIFINNRAGIYGGAISTGFDVNNISVNIISCVFENNTAPMGGAIQIKGNNVKIVNSTFNGNNASDSDGGALFIMGNDALIVNSTFDENFAKGIGAGVLINGSDVSILNSSFNANLASFGGAIYVVGSNANLFSSNFTNHSVVNGSVYIKGENTYVYDSNFRDNLAENGAAIYIYGSNSNLIFNNFTFNNVSRKGGAVYIEGSNANLIASNFLNNSAIPNESDIASGLGGALYIKGDYNTVDSSNFTFNTARNGSAIYTDGYQMTLSNTDFDKNQAWSYILDSIVNPSRSYFNESDILINFTLIGGNNIANAIYNTASIGDIYFYNVSYISSKGSKVTGEDEIHPVNGAQNSNDGSLLYQDDREDNQLVNIVIYKSAENHKNELSISAPSFNEGGSKDIVLNKTFTTGILGDIKFNLSDYIDEPLETGNYIVYAKHFEDDYYKEIDGNNEFEIIPIVDLAINISSSRVNIDFNKTVKYTVKVDNYGPNNATGTIVNAVIPEGLIYVSSSPSVGTYDVETGVWTIGDLNIGDNQTLIINAITNRTGIIDFPVNISSDEEDSNEKNNFNNKSIRVLMADLSINVQASGEEFKYGDLVDWIIIVKNNGPNNASKILVSLSPSEDDLIYLNSSDPAYDSDSSIWQLPSLLVDEEKTLVITSKVNCSNKTISLFGNVSSDTFDPILSNNFDNDSVNVLPLCDLIIKVNMSDDLADYGDIVDLLVVVSNDGPDGASDVSVSLSDLSDLGLDVLEVSDDSFDKDNYEWVIGNLENGESVSLIVPVEIKSSNKTIQVEGIVNTSTFELNKENNRDSDDLSIGPLCDLMIDISISNSTVNNGDIVDLLVVVSNDGPDGASDVSVSLSDLSDLGLDVLDGDDSFNVNGSEWIIGDLDSGESVSLSLTVKTNKSNENLTVTSEVDTSTFEVNKENNLDNDSLRVLPSCDLTITIYPDNAVVNVGENVDWIINVTNKGPDKASDVNVFNSLPEGLEYILSQSSKGEIENFTNEDGAIIDLIWKVGDLANNESAYLVISTEALYEGLIINNASVNSSTFDLNESNNFDSSELKVIVDDNSNQTDSNPDDESNGTDSNFEDESNEENDDGNGDSENNGNDSNENLDDEFPIFDYLLDDDGHNSDNYDSKLDKSKGYAKNLSKKPVVFSNKKTGNPLIIVVLSIFALFTIPFRKN